MACALAKCSHSTVRTCCFPESQMRVCGKGNKLRWLPLAPETIQLLDHYLLLERPSNSGSPLFVILKGRARGARMTAAGLRSLFRHHRRITDLPKANPHRFRHTFARDMLCNGLSLPALMHLMGHSKIQNHHDLCATHRRRGSTGNMPTPWLNTSGAFLRFSHETSPTPPPSIGITVCTFGAISHHCAQRCNQKALRGDVPQLPLLFGGALPRGLPARATATRPAHSGLAGGSTLPYSPLAKITIALRVTFLHRMLQDLAWNEQIPTLAHLLSRADVPRRDENSPRPLLPEQDQLIQQELQRRDDFLSNLLLLQRHTGMRIGECVDLAFDCLFPLGPNQWVIHVPLGKLKTERWVPVDSAVCQIVEHLRTLRSPTSTSDPFLLPRNRTRETLIRRVRAAFRDAVAAVGITDQLVPHQNRHTYATEMLRSGVGLPALMRLLGHASPR